MFFVMSEAGGERAPARGPETPPRAQDGQGAPAALPLPFGAQFLIALLAGGALFGVGEWLAASRVLSGEAARLLTLTSSPFPLGPVIVGGALLICFERTRGYGAGLLCVLGAGLFVDATFFMLARMVDMSSSWPAGF